jgi:hypothetical protein
MFWYSVYLLGPRILLLGIQTHCCKALESLSFTELVIIFPAHLDV